MTGDCHVRFSERPGAKLPRATHLKRTLGSARGASGNRRPLPRSSSPPAPDALRGTRHQPDAPGSLKSRATFPLAEPAAGVAAHFDVNAAATWRSRRFGLATAYHTSRMGPQAG